ncbi:Uncharacterised protein [Klebsiella pneumoniae]|nr:Uncharacterised protein [Klebsiella pneumoniae]
MLQQSEINLWPQDDIDCFDVVFFSLKKFTDNRFVKTSRRYLMPVSEIFGVFAFKTALS